MLRTLLFIHRYAAVAVGVLMVTWCLSGFVMMYQPFPEFTSAERLATLAPLQLRGCCITRFLPDDAAPAGEFSIAMLNGRPVLRQPGVATIALATGTPLQRLQQQDLQQVAADLARRRGILSTPRWLEEVGIDQWSIQSARRNRPVQRFALGDNAGTQIYINGRTGEVFQDTTRRERLLSWMGAIPHWLYPTALRRNGAVWAQVVIWTSLVGTFLAATGLYVGISRLCWRGGRPGSPFRGWWYWHHIAGLFFGVLTLTWVCSGLLTMNPWGLLEGGDTGARVRMQLQGEPPVAELRRFLAGAPGRLEGQDFVELSAQPLGGQLFVLARRADGSTMRLDAAGNPAPLRTAGVEVALAQLDTGLQSLQLLDHEDAYYYSHKRTVGLPVYRAILGDAQHTRVYLSATTGELRIIDRAARRARWFERGLHGLDFAGLRQRPVWDVVALLLLAGVTAVCVTGSWMAIQRVRRDLRRG
ncbi:MAG: PepSY domain-containing protein [Steroidobacteraceae bacterium]